MRISIILLSLIMTFTSCKTNKNKQADFVSFSGKITNHLGNDGQIKADNYSKKIVISADGSFSDTLHLFNQGQKYTFSDGNEVTEVYLKNGDNIHLTLDTDAFDETVQYTGNGSENSNFLAKKMMFMEKNQTKEMWELEEPAFDVFLVKLKRRYKSFVNTQPKIDPTLKRDEISGVETTVSDLKKGYLFSKEREKILGALVGKAAPSFDNYENIDGSTTSLTDLKGKFVYVDVWATWCGPCKAEIPYLKAVEKKYHDRNIEFVSISVDKENAKTKWKQMITDKNMTGIQLIADKDWKSSFVKGFKINSIPRFLLIDDNGIVIDADAPRPSQSSKIENLFKDIK